MRLERVRKSGLGMYDDPLTQGGLWLAIENSFKTFLGRLPSETLATRDNNYWYSLVKKGQQPLEDVIYGIASSDEAKNYALARGLKILSPNEAKEKAKEVVTQTENESGVTFKKPDNTILYAGAGIAGVGLLFAFLKGKLGGRKRK